jgi:hypothetical protein
MTPLDMARRLAADPNPKSQTLATAMIARSLSDHDPSDPFRQGWPLDAATVTRAAEYLGLDASPTLVADALALAPTVSNAILNHRTPR